MLHRFTIALATIAALAMTVPGDAFAAGHGGNPGGHPGGHFAAGGGGPHFAGGHFGGGGRHFGGGRFIGGRGFHRGYAPGYYYGGYAPGYGYDYPPDYGYYEPEPDYGAAAALGIISIISGVMASHAYYHHHHCWLHHGRRVCR